MIFGPRLSLYAPVFFFLASPAAIAFQHRRDGATAPAAAPRHSHTSRHAEDQQQWFVETVKDIYPYYHTSSELQDVVARLANDCKGANLTVRSETDEDASIDYVTVRAANSTPINRFFVLAGEHARELIGPETAIRFLRAICKDSDGAGDDAVFEVLNNTLDSSILISEVLQNTEFAVVVNGNPSSRRKVEDGDFCLRANENGVDLNRNWDEEWGESMDIRTETDKGPEPWSEPETRIFKKLVEEFRPTTFLSVHSGTLGMYMPWAWKVDGLANRNQEGMMDVLKSLDEKRCQCPFGAAGKEVGYPCPGTSVDYVYDQLNSSYAFAFEIWGPIEDTDALRKRWQDKMSEEEAALLQREAHLGHPQLNQVFEPHPRSLLSTGAAVLQDPETCFNIFNPNTESLYEGSVNNWATAIIEMAVMTAKGLKANSSSSD